MSDENVEMCARALLNAKLAMDDPTIIATVLVPEVEWDALRAALARASRPREAGGGAATHFYVAVDGYTISWHRSRDDADAVVSRTPRAVVIESAPAMPQPEACPVAWAVVDASGEFWDAAPLLSKDYADKRVATLNRKYGQIVNTPYRVVPLYATPASAAGREGAGRGYERERAAFDAWWADKSDGYKRATGKGANLSGVAWDAYYQRALSAAKEPAP